MFIDTPLLKPAKYHPDSNSPYRHASDVRPGIPSAMNSSGNRLFVVACTHDCSKYTNACSTMWTACTNFPRREVAPMAQSEGEFSPQLCIQTFAWNSELKAP
eukprot:2412921-Amphidinium_carterae.1